MTAKPPRARKSVTLTSDDLLVLNSLRSGDSIMNAAFSELTGVRISPVTSEAEVLHALLVLGKRLVRERGQDIGYRRAAEVDATDPERQKWRIGMRNRRLRGEGVSHS